MLRCRLRGANARTLNPARDRDGRRALSCGISRNAVIGKLHNVGAATRATHPAPTRAEYGGGRCTPKTTYARAAAEPPGPPIKRATATSEDGSFFATMTIKDGLYRSRPSPA